MSAKRLLLVGILTYSSGIKTTYVFLTAYGLMFWNRLAYSSWMFYLVKWTLFSKCPSITLEYLRSFKIRRCLFFAQCFKKHKIHFTFPVHQLAHKKTLQFFCRQSRTFIFYIMLSLKEASATKLKKIIIGKPSFHECLSINTCFTPWIIYQLIPHCIPIKCLDTTSNELSVGTPVTTSDLIAPEYSLLYRNISVSAQGKVEKVYQPMYVLVCHFE
jgi:hypothetical protein